MNFGGEEIEAAHPLICLLCEVASAVSPRCGACPTGCFTARRAARRFYRDRRTFRPGSLASSGAAVAGHCLLSLLTISKGINGTDDGTTTRYRQP
jgi:hypothetical protein